MPSIWLKLPIPVLALCMAGGAHTDTLSAASAQSKVIVILRDQLQGTPPARAAMTARKTAIDAAQAPLIARLQAAGSRPVRSYSLINAFATSVSPAEAAQLAADPSVKAVVPDRIIHQAHVAREAADRGGATPMSHGSSKTGLCGTLEPQALQLTNAAFLDPSEPQAQQVVDGNGAYVRGNGVKVAFIADGVDTSVAGFTRKDGKPVFVDYKDFSGDGPTAPTAGGEAFGDASSIAAQDEPNGTPLLFDINSFVNEAYVMPTKPCNIRIRGMAPKASLVGLKVFSNAVTTTSNFVQAIDYAVTTDAVDVINESFGGNPYPDNEDDPTSMADSAAVAAGVTVVVSTGDAGTAGTLGSPGTLPDVIAAGASTQFRFYAQTGNYALPLATGYLSDNISSFSSGGFAQQQPRTVDVVAPGDSSWALCAANLTLYADCSNFKTTPEASQIESFGGTSESAPLTSGEAALVIQAYRSTHGGANPTPALVKKIIMSTAKDLGAPVSEQGAGLIDALKAVKMALSVSNSSGTPAARGDGFLVMPSTATITDAGGTAETRSFTITNTGVVTQHLHPVLQTLSAVVAGGNYSLQLDPTTDKSFVGPFGDTRAYVLQNFTVPTGAEHLDAAIAFQSPLGSAILARLALIDPKGRQAAYSVPQGDSSGYGHVDVVKPLAGKWTAVVFTRANAAGYAGPVELSWSAENRAPFGSVAPANLELSPGESATVTASFSMPTAAGDVAAELRFHKGAAETTDTFPAIPVTLRTPIQITSTGGTFSGTLTGGNGRAGAGPTQSFVFEVPSGIGNMNLALQIPDSGYLLEGVLVDPSGMQQSVNLNVDPFGNVGYGLSLNHYNPTPGLWRFVLVQDFTSSGNQTSLPFTARIGFGTAYYTAVGLPDSAATMISASGIGINVPIQIANTGSLTAAYFADARESTPISVPLTALTGCPSTALPFGYGCFNVPTEASAVKFTASSSVPIQMDAFNFTGYGVGVTGAPDIFATSIGTDAVAASLSEPELPSGQWQAVPSEIGPYGAAGEPSASLSMSAQATIQPFDPAFTADSGDYWADVTRGSSTFNPLVLAPGSLGTINVRIKPSASLVGKTVSGFIYIDTYSPIPATGDEIVRIPYEYTVTK